MQSHQQRQVDLHDHYARNARAVGHSDECRKVTDVRNWPTIMGRSPCTCGREPGPTCAVCQSALEPSQALPGAYLHVDDEHEDHTPVLA